MNFEIRKKEVNGETIITLADLTNDTTVELFSFGSLLNSFIVKTAQGKKELVDGFSSIEAATAEMTPAFKSAFLSPFTCRMNKGEFQHAGESYQVEKFFLPPHAIHGLVFDASFQLAELDTHPDYCSATFTYTYNKEDKGYPFQYHISNCWKLTYHNELSVTTTVTHNNESPIPYAQGWHPYFTLGDDTIDKATLQFSTDKIVAFDDTLLPIGHLEEDARFVEPILLKDISLDNCFQFMDTANASCVLANDILQLHIKPASSYPFLQVYTPPHRNSIAIENLSGAPDCFNNGLGLQLIAPNTPAVFSTTYQAVING